MTRHAPMERGDIDRLRRAVAELGERLSTSEGNKKKYDDVKPKFEELFGKLESGEISAAVQGRLSAFSHALEIGDTPALAKLKTEMQSWDWDNNKTWIMALKLVFPRI